MDENVVETKTKESRLKKFGPAIFWGSMIAMPALYMAGSYFGYQEAKVNLEILTKTAELAVEK